jgi:transposase
MGNTTKIVQASVKSCQLTRDTLQTHLLIVLQSHWDITIHSSVNVWSWKHELGQKVMVQLDLYASI